MVHLRLLSLSPSQLALDSETENAKINSIAENVAMAP